MTAPGAGSLPREHRPFACPRRRLALTILPHEVTPRLVSRVPAAFVSLSPRSRADAMPRLLRRSRRGVCRTRSPRSPRRSARASCRSRSRCARRRRKSSAGTRAPERRDAGAARDGLGGHLQRRRRDPHEQPRRRGCALDHRSLARRAHLAGAPRSGAIRRPIWRVVRVEAKNLVPAKFADSDTARVGEWVRGHRFALRPRLHGDHRRGQRQGARRGRRQLGRGLSADRRQHQPRQLGRTARQPRWPGARHQHDDRGARPGDRLRRARRTWRVARPISW